MGVFRFLAGWTGRIIAILVLLLVVLVGFGAIFYFTDQHVDATIVEKRQESPTEPCTVKAKTERFGITQETEIQPQECALVRVGAFVQYYVRSQRTVIFASKGGACLWDSSIPGPCT